MRACRPAPAARCARAARACRTGAASPAAAQADFYKGKTIELIISTGVGGGLDANGRIVARHLGNHIPGNPTIVAKNMPGAGHIRAANYVFNQAPKDGTTIGTFIPIFVMAQVLERSKSIQFNPGEFPVAGLDLVQQLHGLCLAHHRREDARGRHADARC